MAEVEKLSICVLILSVTLAILSSTIVYFGITLFVFFKFHLLGFASVCFPAFAIIVIVMSSLTLINCIWKISLIITQSTLICNIFLDILLTLLQIVGFIMALELRNYLQFNSFQSSTDLTPMLTSYNENPWIHHQVDQIQTFFKCCGGHGTSNAYQVWMNIEPYHSTKSVPKSCCLDLLDPNCGDEINILDDENHIHQKVHSLGCLDAIGNVLEQEVAPALFIYGIFGILLCLVHR